MANFARISYIRDRSMKRLFTLLLLLISTCCTNSFSQTDSKSKVVNLVQNGSFELGNSGFSSGYAYEVNYLSPGQYTVTRFASSLNKDYVNPVQGDHTTGHGYYMVIDSDGEPGKKAWCTTVNVIPNSIYRFSVYFCNLYKHKGSHFGFQLAGTSIGGHPFNNDPKIKFSIAGKQEGETEADIFHLFRWVSATAEWYSGTHSGPIEICIENANFTVSGNDMALDDIEFIYIKTMPPGYAPPKKTTIMVKEEAISKVATKRRIVKFEDLFRGDSIAPGIYTIYPSKKPATSTDTLKKKGERIHLNNVIFAQGKADLLPEAESELNRLATWMKDEPSMRIRLEGHTDNQGKPELNIKLSEERVATVKEYLVNKGVASDRIETVGFGGSFPIEDNSKEETRKLNRRVEFQILDDKK